jgi:hypothetical protein
VAVGECAESPNAKTLLFPVEATQLVGTRGGLGELAREAIGGRRDAGGGNPPPPAPRRGPVEGGQQ